MPPKKRKTAAAASPFPIRKSTRQNTASAATCNVNPADLYSDMLMEAAYDGIDGDGDSDRIEGRKPKRRRVGNGKAIVTGRSSDIAPEHSPEPPRSASKPQQVIYDDSPTSGDEESDLEFEDVALDPNAASEEQQLSTPTAADRATSDLNIAVKLEADKVIGSKRRAANRLPSSTVEKQKRIAVHKVHLCCLLAHVYVRNAWCNDGEVQRCLTGLIGDRTRAYLHPPNKESQFQRSRSLHDGLQQASDAFRVAFKITARGLRRPQWNVNGVEQALLKNTETAIDKSTFLKLAKKRQGSRDIGAQLFCALLRGLDVDARLVCSLQPLSFASAPPAPSPQKTKQTIRMTGSDEESAHSGSDSAASNASSVVGNGVTPNIPPPIKRFGSGASRNTISNADLGQAPSPVKRKKIVESKYPIYWVEVFDAAYQKWIAVDPLVTRTVDKPQKLEPPLVDSGNDMSYVIAFDENGSAKDVTRRYAKAYNAKTRRARVEATKDGQRWWKRAMKMYRGPKEDRDQVEDAELSRKEAAEPMPRNVQDFKDHPYYAIERHLKHNEVVFPKREVGKLTTGKGVVESIYRRSDVQVVRSADKWYRSAGREIKAGEQPLKYSSARRPPGPHRNRSASPADISDERLPLYAHHQTTLLIPPPCTPTSIPNKTAFSTIHIPVPSLLPPNSIHIHNDSGDASKAAKILGIEYADAVVGWKFQGRRGTPVVDGIVVARECGEAVASVVEGLREVRREEEAKGREREAMKWWVRFFKGLKVRERIMGYQVEGEDTAHKEEEVQEAMKMEADDDAHAGGGGGGFLSAEDQTTTAPLFPMDSSINDFDFPSPSNPNTKELLITPSPWDEGGPLYHLNPYKSSPHRQKPTLVRKHTPGLFLSPTRVDEEVEDGEGGGFFGGAGPDGEGDQGGGFIVDGDDLNGDGGGGGFIPEGDDEDEDKDGQFGGGRTDDAFGKINEQGREATVPAIKTYDSLFEEPIPSGEAENTEDAALEVDKATDPTTQFSVAKPKSNHEEENCGNPHGNGADDDEDDEAENGPGNIERNVEEAGNAENGGIGKVKAERDEDEEKMSDSLFSHDEDDDDAEPEWLVDEIGW